MVNMLCSQMAAAVITVRTTLWLVSVCFGDQMIRGSSSFYKYSFDPCTIV